jgi:hypothetical protein
LGTRKEQRPHVITVIARTSIADGRLTLSQDDRLDRHYALITTAATQGFGAESKVDEKSGIDQVLKLPPVIGGPHVVIQEYTSVRRLVDCCEYPR